MLWLLPWGIWLGSTQDFTSMGSTRSNSISCRVCSNFLGDSDSEMRGCFFFGICGYSSRSMSMLIPILPSRSSGRSGTEEKSSCCQGCQGWFVGMWIASTGHVSRYLC